MDSCPLDRNVAGEIARETERDHLYSRLESQVQRAAGGPALSPRGDFSRKLLFGFFPIRQFPSQRGSLSMSSLSKTSSRVTE